MFGRWAPRRTMERCAPAVSRSPSFLGPRPSPIPSIRSCHSFGPGVRLLRGSGTATRHWTRSSTPRPASCTRPRESKIFSICPPAPSLTTCRTYGSFKRPVFTSSARGSPVTTSTRCCGAWTTIGCPRRRPVRAAPGSRRFILKHIRQRDHRTVSPNLYMRVQAGASDGGSEDDHGHGSWDDSPGSADARPPRNARTPAIEFDSPARSDVSRVPRGEPFPRGTLPRGGPCRGRDGASPRPLGRRTKTRPSGGPLAPFGPPAVLPYPRACPEPRALSRSHAPHPADHHRSRRQRFPGGPGRLPGRQADPRGPREAYGGS